MAVTRSPPPHCARAVRATPSSGRSASSTQATASTTSAVRAVFWDLMRLKPAQKVSTVSSSRTKSLVTSIQ